MGAYPVAGGNKIKAILTGLAVVIVCMILLSLLVSLIVYLTPAKDLILDKLAVLISGISLFFGGLAVGLSAGEKGLVLGLITAVLAVLLLFLVNGGSGLLGMKVVVCIVAGGLGGVIGVR